MSTKLSMMLRVAPKEFMEGCRFYDCYCSNDLFDDLCWHSIMISANE